jgi:hypothetical protein
MRVLLRKHLKLSNSCEFINNKEIGIEYTLLANIYTNSSFISLEHDLFIRNLERMIVGSFPLLNHRIGTFSDSTISCT